MSGILRKTLPRFSVRLMYALRPIGILTLWLAVVAGSVWARGAEPAKGPLRVHPENPRYFTDGSGRAVYLTGSHTWNNLVDMAPGPTPAAFDYNAFLDWTQRYGHNFIRMWAWELLNWDTAGNSPSYSKNTVLSVAPHPWARSGPGEAFDGRPKFDLGKFNPEYFRRLRSRIGAAGKRGIYVSVMLFEGWGIRKAPGAWKNHPFHPENNINRLDGDANGDGKGIEIHTLAVPAVTAVQTAYVRQVINTVNDFDNVLYEIVNEAHPSSTEWQHHMIRFVQDYERGKPKQHPVGMTAQRPKTSDRPLFEGPADWISPDGNALANTGTIEPGAWISPVGPRGAPTAYAGNKVVLSDTDHLGGIWGNEDWVWKTFLSGMNPLFMDPYDAVVLGERFDPRWEPVRRSMGYTLAYARRMNLAATRPLPELSSTNYCLASPGHEYLVYLPSGGAAVVDLSEASGELAVEWFVPATGITRSAETTSGGRRVEFSAPFSGPAVLYLRRNEER